MSKYWEARQEKREELSFKKGTDAYKEYVKSLEQAKENINAKIAKLYAKHSEDTGLAKAESMKIIQGKEYKEWRYKVEDYVKQLNSIKDKNSIEFKKLSLELETLASRSRINRFESLKADIDMELIKAGVKANDTMSNALTKTYADTYKSLIDDLNYKSTVDMDKIKKVIGHDWSGANYSKRIWGNTESLAKTIKNEVLIGLNQGINYKTMSTRIANKFETSKKNAERLVRTEINYIHNQATVDGYKDAGIEKYQFLATLDSRTSQTCASLNGEVFEVKNIAVGINYPPMHPRCRSTTVPIIDYASLANMSERDFEEKVLTNQEKNSTNILKGSNNYEKAVEKVLEYGKATGNEGLMWLDLEGNEIIPFKTGTHNRVVITPDIIKHLRSLEKDTVISLHNHPKSSSFSPADMHVACLLPSVKEMRVIAHDGTKYFLRVGDGRRPESHIIEDTFYQIRNDLEVKYLKLLKEEKDELKVWKEWSNEINKNIAEKFNWEYRRENEK